MKEECAGAVTAVFWNMDTCPVPSGFDARRVGPCIKGYLKKLGYTGPLTMCAFGLLTDVPSEVLRAVSSTGFVLNIDPYGSRSLSSYLFCWTINNRPPANIMVITHSTDRETSIDLDMTEHGGFNIIRPYPLGPASSTNAECLWKSFLLAESEEDYPIETGESAWVCNVCPDLATGQGFDNFTTHISSREHAVEKLGWKPRYPAAEEDEVRVDHVEPTWKWLGFAPPPRPKPRPSQSMHQPKPWEWECFPPYPHPHIFATSPGMIQPKASLATSFPYERFPPHPHMFATPSVCSHCATTISPKPWEISSYFPMQHMPTRWEQRPPHSDLYYYYARQGDPVLVPCHAFHYSQSGSQQNYQPNYYNPPMQQPYGYGASQQGYPPAGYEMQGYGLPRPSAPFGGMPYQGPTQAAPSYGTSMAPQQQYGYAYNGTQAQALAIAPTYEQPASGAQQTSVPPSGGYSSHPSAQPAQRNGHY